MALGLSSTMNFYSLLLLIAFSWEVSSSPTFAEHAQVKRSVSELRDSYDYVVIGGGTSGLVVANRLSEDRSSKFEDYLSRY